MGFINREPFNGTGVTDKGMDYDNTTVVRGALKFAPSDAVTITPSIYYQKQRTQDNYFWLTLSNPSESDFNNGYTQAEPVVDSFTLPALNVHWRLDGMELISNTSYFYRDLTRVSDYSNFIWNVFAGSPTPTDPLPGYRSTSDDAVRQNSFTQEVRLQSSTADSRLQWVAGALFQSARLYTNQYINDPQLGDLTQALFGAPVEDILGESLIDGRYSGKIDQWATDKQSALFGQADYAITSQLKGTLGVRVARTTLDFNRVYGGPLLCTLCNGEPEHTGGLDSRHDSSHASHRAFLRARRSQSLLRLGVEGLPRGRREQSFNRDGHPRMSDGVAAARDLPARQPVELRDRGKKPVCRRTPAHPGQRVLHRLARHPGVSVEQHLCHRVIQRQLGAGEDKGLRRCRRVARDPRPVALGNGWLLGREVCARLVRAADANGVRPIIAADGDSLGVSPWNAVASGQYDFNAFQRPTYLRVDYSYIGKDTDKTPQQDPVTSVYDPGLVTDSSIRLLEARLGMRFGGVDVSVFGRNLLNDAPILGVNHDGAGDPLYYATTIRPRSIGLTATYRY